MTVTIPVVEAQGVRVPALGLGTWKLTGAECRRTVGEALELGYRHLDTAQMYGNEADVGAAIHDAGIDPAELFVVTKVADGNRTAHDVRRSTLESLEALRLEAIDLLLVHHPADFGRVAETLTAMAELQDEGVVRHLGVSNFSPDQVEESLRHAPIVCHQVEHSVYDQRPDLVDDARRHDLVLTAYTPLGHGDVDGDERLAEVARRHGKTPAQVAIRWLLDQPDVVTIPKASSRDHLEENLDVFDFALDDDDRARIAELDRGRSALT